ncbi:MAG: hypothetical protein DSO07_08925 [Thermoproteota archaeon]|jgi:ADP-ribosylglycohydrolase|uniref:ADP-ribosylglycohydrolase family protein n=1 Tax=Candidatus Methanodesulfokora washburnensis TaxID=2478471 RepID=A0A3R9QTF6_9CREN|nr:ADP-ribosylglycohydrolase family protein [Candidatus Methanodesulfokores washburnensis]RSN72806.1 hypothetical protein D6D85_12220 [Candidatus Methanodesulfokores washburnensis]RZN62163.1 MAG: hypothetical protein EF810_03455 [Candidatus Methanodesulfokores washburnensis]TDA40590.1 MAG: hypothetical protein DSO07_08925 [Candidatus Korarchaeota archaeon]
MNAQDRKVSKAHEALMGLVIGDAFGMPTTSYTPAIIKKLLGEVGDFLDAPSGHPLHSGLKAGIVTDDTEIAILIAKIKNS